MVATDLGKEMNTSSQANDSNGSRTIAIGDIHGCLIAFETLLGTILPTPNDTVVILGDFIDRGQNTCGVIERLIDLGNRCNLVALLGNHEEMLLASVADPSALKEWRYCGGDETLLSYGCNGGLRLIPEEHWEFIRATKDYFETDDHIFVHASYSHDSPMKHVSPGILRWRNIEDTPCLPHFSGKTVIVGHSAQHSGEILDRTHSVCIDTHCYGGGWLTALNVNNGEIWQANERGEIRPRRSKRATPGHRSVDRPT